MLLGNFDVLGGNGGNPGCHGKGGKGGKEGKGGKPFTYDDPILDREGNTVSSREITKAGGNDGIKGYDGLTPTETLFRGGNGSKGNFEYGVINEYSKWEPRDEKFCKLEISKIDCVTQYNSGIVEPGSTIKLGMEVFNAGCPTPKFTPIRIELDEYIDWINNSPMADAPTDLQHFKSKYVRSEQGMEIKINDPKKVTNGIPLHVPITLSKFKATMTQINRPVDISARDSVSFVIQQPIYISEIISIRSPGGLQYEVFWIVNNISFLDFGKNSTFKRLIRTKLTKGGSNGIEIDNQEIKYLGAHQSLQVTSKILLDNYNYVHQFTVTLQIGDNKEQPNILKTVQTREFTIRAPRTEDIPHLFLDVTKNECENLDSNTSFCEETGSIDLTLSKEIHYSIKGTIQFGDGTKIQLDHYFDFDKDAYIYITQKTSPKKCVVNLTTYEDESHIFALIANTFDDESNEINWNFQTTDRNNNTITKYPKPFKFRIAAIFPHNERNYTRNFEPNCKGFIRGIAVYNEGRMPSPKNQDIIISLLPTSNIFPDDSFFIINKSIREMDFLELTNVNLKFSIKNNENGFRNTFPLRIKDQFNFNSNIKSLNHTIQDFNAPSIQEITIQYPIEIGEFLGYRNPSAAEEIYSLYWKVKNTSDVEFGRTSNIRRLIVTSVDNNIPDALYTKEIESLMNENYSLEMTKIKINDMPSLDPFNFKLYLGSIEQPNTLLPIQSHPFHLLPLSRGDTFKRFDLVFDLNDGRLTLNNLQPNDYVEPGKFQLTISTPKSNDAKIGDVKIQGTLQYTNGWIINIDDQFTLDVSGWIYLYTCGKNNNSTGSINIKIAQEDTHLLSLIDKPCLEKCDNQLYQVIENNETPNLITEYNSIYQFTLMNYDFTSDDDSGIYEPDGRITIRRIEIKNTGSMPTPTSHDVEISVNLLNSNQVSSLNDNKLILPKPIGNSETKILNPIKTDDELCLDFKINQQGEASQDKPLNITGMVDLRAVMFGINREITNFTLKKEFKIQYPIQICSDTKIEDFQYHNNTRITWRLNNISKIDFGSESKMKRIIKVQVKIKKMSPENSLKFKTNHRLDDIFEQEISLLEAKQSCDMFCELVRTLKDRHSKVIDADLSITLYIGSIEFPDKMLDIEIRNKYIEVFPNYESNNSDILLVANSKTTKKDTDYWDDLVSQELGLSMSIWNIKSKGHFDLFESGIIKDYSGKSIVILNDELNDENFNQTIDYLDPFQFCQAVNNYNVKFFIIGKNFTDQKIKELFIPKEMIKTKPIATHNKIKSYIKDTKKKIISEGEKLETTSNEDGFPERGSEEINARKLLDLECINTNLQPSGINCFASPDSYRMNKLRRLSKSLQKIYPGRRYILLSTYHNKIILCEITNRTKQYLTYNSVQLDKIDEKQIGKMSMIGLLSCIPFSKKLEKLQEILLDPKQAHYQETLKKLIEADLAMELNGLCGLRAVSKKMKSIIPDILLKQLILFRQFCKFVKFIVSKENSITSKNTDWAIEIFGRLKALLLCSKNKGFFKNNTRIDELEIIIHDECLKAFEKYNNQIIIYLNRRAEKKDLNKENLILTMTEILSSNNLKTETELLNDDLDLIISEDYYKNVEQKHNHTSLRREKTKTKYREKVELLERQTTIFTEINIGSEGINHGTEVNRGLGSEEINHGIEVNRGAGSEVINHGTEVNREVGSEEINQFNHGIEVNREVGSEEINHGTEVNDIDINNETEGMNQGNDSGTETE
jgi:hypothetical protein